MTLPAEVLSLEKLKKNNQKADTENIKHGC